MGLFGPGKDTQEEIDEWVKSRDHLDYDPPSKEEVEEDYREAVLRVWERAESKEEWCRVSEELWEEYELWIQAAE